MNDSHDHAPAGPARVVLAERENAGIQVTLLWAEDTDAVAVLVRDDGTERRVRTERGTRGQRARRLRTPLRLRRVAWRQLPARRPQSGVTSRQRRPRTKTRRETLGETFVYHMGHV